MPGDMLDAVINAKSAEEREKALRALEKVGVDRYTADVLVSAGVYVFPKNCQGCKSKGK